MNRGIALLALVAACGGSAGETAVELPRVSVGLESGAGPALVATLTGDGRLWVEGSPLTVGGLAARLSEGPSLVLRADRDAPWGWITWIRRVAAEWECRGFSLAVLDPYDREKRVEIGCWPPGPGGPEPRRLVWVGVDGADYRFGADRTNDPGTLVDPLRSSRAGARGPVIAGVRGGSRLPCDTVVALLAVFREAGFEHFLIEPVSIPASEVRAATPLPEPAEDWSTGRTGAWDEGER